MKNLMITSIRFYQRAISPVKMSKCPFVPSCSEYSVSSLESYGFVKGSFLGFWRILRCNPFNKGYYDPPENWAGRLHLSKPLLKKPTGSDG
ncbi:MAG: membrane protein insertion efficiency factor YidD [Candidatus Delongbacteria bacterium]|nr:membrane protein insertion efficiency factor YidD [Candidatus Delongbacteria bacterium]